MKVKNNTKNLIPRKQIGGLIPKFQNSGHIEKRWYGNVWVKDKPTSYHTEKRWYGTISVPDKVSSKALPKVDRSVTQAEIDEVKKLNAGIQASKDKPTNIKPAGTRGNGSKGGTRGSGIRGNARTTAKPAATTFTESPTNITDQGWLDARNAAMQRGWGTYNYNGQTYEFTGDEYKQAANNWRNRRKAGYQAEGILNLSGVNVPDNLVIDNNEAREIESTVPQTKPVDTKTTPMTYWYQRGTLAKNPEITREALWQATQAVRNGDRDASYYGESSDLISQLARDNQDSAKNYIYNLWNTNNDVATQAGRKNYTESQGLTFGEPTTSNTNKDPLQSWATDFLKRSARQGAKLISRKQ